MTLWWATLGGLVAWAAHLVASYLAVALVCGEERRLAVDPTVALVAISGIALGAAVWATAVAFRLMRDGSATVRRLAFGGLLMDLLGVVAIAAGGVIPAFLRPCG